MELKKPMRDKFERDILNNPALDVVANYATMLEKAMEALKEIRRKLNWLDDSDCMPIVDKMIKEYENEFLNS